jgi:hypothetical protein
LVVDNDKQPKTTKNGSGYTDDAQQGESQRDVDGQEAAEGHSLSNRSHNGVWLP